MGLSHLNTNAATGNSGVYKIAIDGELYKFNKTDMGRITQSTEQPTRLHQQIRILGKTHGRGNVQGTILEFGHKTTTAAETAETVRLDDHHKKQDKSLKVIKITNKKVNVTNENSV